MNRRTLKILNLVHVDDVSNEHWVVYCWEDDVNTCKWDNVRAKSKDSCLQLSYIISVVEHHENRSIERGRNTITIGGAYHRLNAEHRKPEPVILFTRYENSHEISLATKLDSKISCNRNRKMRLPVPGVRHVLHWTMIATSHPSKNEMRKKTEEQSELGGREREWECLSTPLLYKTKWIVAGAVAKMSWEEWAVAKYRETSEQLRNIWQLLKSSLSSCKIWNSYKIFLVQHSCKKCSCVKKLNKYHSPLNYSSNGKLKWKSHKFLKLLFDENLHNRS